MRTVKLLTYPGAVMLDIAAPLQVFRHASTLVGQSGAAPTYDLSLVSLEGGAVPVGMDATLDTERLEVNAIDTFMIPGASTEAIDNACATPDLIEAVRAQARFARRVASMGPGVFILAQAGLLRGRRVAAHWTDAERFDDYDEIDFVTDAYVVDGKYWTSGGMLSSTDLALAMVEADLGADAASRTARHLVTGIRRGFGDPQLSARAEAVANRNRIRALMQWIVDNPAEDLSANALAKRAYLSMRSLHRRFTAEAGETPARFVERARTEAAQRILAATDKPVEAIATECGFSSASVMHGAFVRLIGQSPSRYRKRMRETRRRSE